MSSIFKDVGLGTERPREMPGFTQQINERMKKSLSFD